MSKTRRMWRLLALALVAALFGSACFGGGGNSDGTDGTSAAGGSEVSGSLVISGSSTVEPISAAVAQKFASQNPDVNISVDGPGTGDGFELFCNGETDISDASRPIDTEEEVPACEENGVEFIELKVGIDGIAVLTSPENEEVSCLSFADLYALLGIESEGADNWSDAQQIASDLGSDTQFPDAALEITAPGEESGTYDSFVEIVLEDIAVEERGQSEDGPFVRPDYQASGDDNVIIEGISGNPTSLGWVGFAFYMNNSDAVRAIPIAAEPNGECIEPTVETIQSTEYPISRDLFIYVNKGKLESNPALQAYVDYYLSDEGIATVGEVGYVDLDDAALEETRGVWESQETGTREG
ncbi:MAG: phosphate ABC transporter substrate-binding protein PstS family protein [Actinomycetota bacterium]